MRKQTHRTERGWMLGLALALLVSINTNAQIQVFEFSGTVEETHPWIDFGSIVDILPGWEVQAGDPVTGSFKVDPKQVSHIDSVQGLNIIWPTNNQFVFGGVTDWSLKVGGREIFHYEQGAGDVAVIGGFKDYQQDLAFPLIGNEADSISFVSPWEGIRVADGFDGAGDVPLGVILNLTDSFGEWIGDAVYPSRISLEEFDYTKGFIHTFNDAGERSREGILFNIDHLQLVDTILRPLIKEGPESRVVSQGDDVLLSSELETTSASVQWFLNGVEIMEQQQSDLSLEDIQPAQSGTYMMTAMDNVQTNTAIARIQVESREHFLTPIALKGWNADVIVEPGGDALKHTDFDGRSSMWITQESQRHVAGFPETGRFTSSSGSGVLYQLQPLEQNNVLLLSERATSADNEQALSGSPVGQLELVNPRSFTSIAIVAASGGGTIGGKGSVTLHFADGSSSPEIPLNADDWWTRPDVVSPTAIAGLYRMNVQTGTEITQSGSDYGFGLYETMIDLSAMGLDGKMLTGMEFTMASASKTGIFAVSGQSAEIHLGTHVTWPKTDSAFLEIATSPDTGWNGFEELLVMADGTHAGVVPEGVLPRYQRSLPADLESDLLAHYTFVMDGRDRLGKSDPMELSNAEPDNGTLFLNGGYERDASVDGFAAKAEINGFSYTRFTVAVDFKGEDFDTPGNHLILMGGPSYRWLGFESRRSRLALMLDNGSNVYLLRDSQIKTDGWNRLICSFNARDGANGCVIRTQLNGQILEEIYPGARYQLPVVGTLFQDRDKVFAFTNYGQGTAFHGYADNLMVFGRDLTDAEMQTLNQALSGKPLVNSSDPNAGIQTHPHVSWKSNLDSFDLQWANSLNGPWLPVAETPYTIADLHFVPMDFQQGMKVYRLSRPE